MRFHSTLLMLATLALAACQDSTNNDTPVPIESTTFASALGVNLSASTKTAAGLYYRDITVGTGATVATGQSVSTFYTLWLPNGTQLETLQSPSTPINFRLGAGAVVEGWDKGIPGMKVGGTRQLILPSSLAYGTSGNGSVPPNSVLVFNVTVTAAQ
jgi:FKBP-type peptidyl-prolyl cis-trans isomerase